VIMANSVGRTIKLFLVDGSPDGMLTAEIMNWTGHVLFAPRSRIVDLLQRPEVKRTGVYLLVGKDPDHPDQPLVYVGEGDSVSTRLYSHNRDEDKEFWEYACVITSKDLNLTKAHVRYLESRIIELVAAEGRARLWNKSDPGFDLLPEADISDMEDFILRLQVLLPVLGIQFFRPTPKLGTAADDGAGSADAATRALPVGDERTSRTSFGQVRPTAAGGSSPEFKLSARGIEARAVELGGQMIVLSGSLARAEEQPSLASNVRTYRQQLRQSGKLVQTDNAEILRFATDVAFNSPSAAAQAVMGTSRNGRTDWVIRDTGQTYADWQEAEITRTGSPPDEVAADALSGRERDDL
jgi:hypothetical protein